MLAIGIVTTSTRCWLRPSIGSQSGLNPITNPHITCAALVADMRAAVRAHDNRMYLAHAPSREQVGRCQWGL